MPMSANARQIDESLAAPKFASPPEMVPALDSGAVWT
jgi:hypothetical protein